MEPSKENHLHEQAIRVHGAPQAIAQLQGLHLFESK